MTAVQNLVAIRWIEIELQQNGFQIEFELWWKKTLVKWAPDWWESGQRVEMVP